MIVSNKRHIFYIAIAFVILYGSGFVGAKIGFPFANPISFLIIRFFLSTCILLVLAILLRARWQKSMVELTHIVVSGILLVCIFSIGTWVSMDSGVPPATSALIIALQPILVTIGSILLFNQTTTWRTWLGLFLGLFGVVLVVIEHAKFNQSYLFGILFSVLGLIGLACGSLYQKKFCPNLNIWTTGVIQSASSGVICLIISLVFNIKFQINFTPQFIFALLWMCGVVSLGAISLLYILILNGEAAKVASLFYLVPVVTAVISYFVFKIELDKTQVLGMIIASTGVGLVNLKLPPIVK